MKHQITVASALAAVVALGGLAAAKPASAEATERCFGVAKKAHNDCGNSAHTCAGLAAADNLPGEWKRVAKGTCEKLGGKLAPPARDDKK